MRQGLAILADYGVTVEVRRWEHSSLVELAAGQSGHRTGWAGGCGAAGRSADGPRRCRDAGRAVRAGEPEVARCGSRTQGHRRRARGHRECGHGHGHGTGHLRAEHARAQCAGGGRMHAGPDAGRSPQHRPLARRTASGRWEREFPNSQAIPELCGKTVGLVGYGAVASWWPITWRRSAVASWPTTRTFRAIRTGPARVRSTICCGNSDIVSLHARLTPENHHLIGAGELAIMKRSAILVNTARSGLVDEVALVHALQGTHDHGRGHGCV